LIPDAPLELLEIADTLQYMSLRVELITVDGPPSTPVQRVYVHDPAIPPHKIAFNHNSSDFLRGLPRHAIMAETSLSEDKPVDVDSIAPKTIGLLCDLGLVSSPKDVLNVGSLNVRYGYPVYTKDRPEKVAAIKEWLERHDIYSAGRFGDWDYVNSDKCVARGLALGSFLRERYGSRAARETDISAPAAARRTVVA
jgi:protoporphyrinogen oxidase